MKRNPNTREDRRRIRWTPKPVANIYRAALLAGAGHTDLILNI